MRLDESVRKIADNVFQAISGITKDAKYHRFQGAAYSASLGGPGGSFITTNIQVVVNQFRSREVEDQQILAGDQEILLSAQALNNVVPTPNDKIEMDGQIFNIVNVESDPALAVYTLQVRAK